MRRRIANIELLKYKYRKYLILLGDAYVHNENYERGLSVWEEYVLKEDASNEYVHRRLDELLKTANIKT